MPHLARIAVYPIKSLDPLWVDAAQLLPYAGLENDRRFALRDLEGQFVNGKRTAAIHALAGTYDPATRTVSVGLRTEPDRQSFRIDAERVALEAWLGRHIDLAVELHENAQEGFPDDLESPGPTVISTATLRAVAEWFPGVSLDEARLRFRANLEIDGVEPFWEDRLYATAGSLVQFRIGDTVLAGTNPCQRCIVPTRSPSTGEVIWGFSKIFAERRQATLPTWAERSRFNHFYRLAVNTRTIEAGRLAVGDELTILAPDRS
jgi:uncharacterized protein